MNDTISPIITCTRRHEFDAGHRLLNHEGKCAHIHGHRYVAEITCQAHTLDHVGRVVDFSVIEKEVGSWIDTRWDHGFVVYQHDYAMCEFLVRNKQKHFTLEVEPTAENMAKLLLDVSGQLLKRHHVQVIRVRLWETPNCFAEVSRGDQA